MGAKHRGVVVIAEADDDSRHRLATHLVACGFVVRHATSADAAVSLANGADVVVTAIWLHDSFEGLGLVQRLRCVDPTRRIPIIVVTSAVFDAAKERAEAAGCDLFLRKPCEPAEVVRAIRALLARRRLPSPRLSVSASSTERGRHSRRRPL